MTQKRLSKKKCRLHVSFVDFKKSFDLVNRDKLWFLLKSYRHSGKILNALKRIYTLVNSFIRGKAHGTPYSYSPSGLRQGCILNPLLFSLFISKPSKDDISNGKYSVQLFPDLLKYCYYYYYWHCVTDSFTFSFR